MTSALLGSDELADLILELRESGYDVGTEECLNAQRLMLALAAFGVEASSPSDLEPYLSPLFCSSPVDQERFGPVYQRWARARFPSVEAPAGRGLEGARQNVASAPRLIHRFQPWQYVAALCFLVSVGLIAWLWRVERAGRQFQAVHGVVLNADSEPAADAQVYCGARIGASDAQGRFECSFRPIDYPVRLAAVRNSARIETQLTAPPGSTITLRLPKPSAATTKQATKQASYINLVTKPLVVKTYFYYYWWIFGAIVSLPLLILGGWLIWIYLPRSRLVRWRRGGIPKLDRLPVSGGQIGLFKAEGFRRAAQELRRHRQVGSSDLNAEKTIVATVERAGRFSPIYLLRQALPDYLILIDRANRRDHLAEFFDGFVKYLRGTDVFVESYTFNSDPRLLYKDGDPAKSEALTDLAARFPDHTLLVFSDARGVVSSLSGRLQPWTEIFSSWRERALLVPEDAELDPHIEYLLTESGFLVVPQSSEGMIRLAGVLHTGLLEHAGNRGPVEYPPLLREEPERWLRLPPEPSSIGRLLMQISRYLGGEGFTWLGACAVYPQLDWNLTLYLGSRLKGAAPDTRLLSKIVRLPWFRHGFMPDWLRSALILSLPAERRRQVREAMQELLLTALESPRDGFALEIATGVKPVRQPLWKRIALLNLLRTEPGSSPFRDYVLLSFLAGRESKDLSPLLPRRLSSYFRRFTHPRRPWIPAMAAVLVSCTAAASLWKWYPPRSAPPPLFVDTPPAVPGDALVRKNPIEVAPGTVSTAPVTTVVTTAVTTTVAPKKDQINGGTYYVYGQPVEDIYFDRKSSAIRKSEISKLVKIAASIKKLSPSQRVWLEANGDGTDAAAAEVSLSYDRGLAVQNFLLQQGVSGLSLNAIVYANKHAVCTPTDNLCLERNRFVHFAERDPAAPASTQVARSGPTLANPAPTGAAPANRVPTFEEAAQIDAFNKDLAAGGVTSAPFKTPPLASGNRLDAALAEQIDKWKPIFTSVLAKYPTLKLDISVTASRDGKETDAALEEEIGKLINSHLGMLTRTSYSFAVTGEVCSADPLPGCNYVKFAATLPTQ